MPPIDEKSFDVRDARFEAVVACDVAIERLGTGFGFTEGPAWDARNRQLIFSDMKHDWMRCWSPSGGIATFRKPSNKSNDFEQPNGICFSLDERALFVNDTVRKHIRRFDVLPDGGVAGGDVWAQTVGEEPGVPDGMKVDTADHLFCTGRGGIHVFDTAACLLGVIRLPERPANFTWGGDDHCSLFVTATTSLYRLRTRLPGCV